MSMDTNQDHSQNIKALISGVLGLLWDEQSGDTEAECFVSWGLVLTVCIVVTSYALVTSQFKETK